MGGVTYPDPDGREVVFAPFVFGANEPEGGSPPRPSSENR